MIIKSPPVYDTSHWKVVPDFALVSPRPFLVLTKATEGASYVDDTFVRYFNDLKQDGIHRGAYHFFRKALNATAQAKLFCDTVRPLLMAKDILILDVEEGGESAIQLKLWFQYCMGEFPNHLFMLYSRKNILDLIPMTSTDKTFFRDIPVWTAGYPFAPDVYNNVPTFYIPDQSKFGPVDLWQYTDSGVVSGISGGVDCNWISPMLIARLGTVTPPATGGTMKKGVVNTGYVLMVRDSANADTGIRLEVGDIVYGPVTSNRIYFERIYRRNGTLQLTGGNVATVDPANTSIRWVTLTDETEPAPPVRTITDINIQLASGSVVTTRYSDGTTETQTA